MDAGGLFDANAAPVARPRLQRIEAVVNTLAGHAGPDAPAAIQQIASQFGLDCNLRAPEPDKLWSELRAAVDTAPDLLVVVAGDGTAGAAASLCGPDGPLLAPLAGGTMNMLPHALYGVKDWRSALVETLTDGVETPVSGGEIDGRRFYVAAILGEPALWAEAREAARMRQLQLAWRKGRHAWRRAFSHRIRYCLDGGPKEKTLALTLMCPLVSKAMSGDERALEAARLDPQGVAQALRLGARTMLSQLAGDWRDDPSVEVARCRSGMAWSGGRYLRAVLDGEPTRLHKQAEIRFLPRAFRALAPPAGRRETA